MLVILPGAALYGVLLAILFPHGLGWWWLLALPASPLAVIPLGVPARLAIALLEWLLVAPRRCPRCRSRAWSIGTTRGFGL